MARKTLLLLRMMIWLTLIAATTWLLWYTVKVPSTSYSGDFKPLTAEEKLLAENLRRHVVAVASREHNVWHWPALEEAAQYIELAFAASGYARTAQRFETAMGEVRNIEVQVPGHTRASEIVLVGAHYDSALGATGANDNGSGVAAVLELARLFKGAKPTRTLRFVTFVNEEPPFFKGDESYPALMVTDTAPYRYPHYHTAQDTADKVDWDRLARVVIGLHHMLRELAK